MPPYITREHRREIALSYPGRPHVRVTARLATISHCRRSPSVDGYRSPTAVVEHCMGFSITLTINGVTRTIALDDPRVTLLDLLRERLDLTGTKKGCDRGQCGFCTPGQIMSAIGLIQEGQAGADPEHVRESMSGNLCRCGAYQGITEAVLTAQRTLDAASRKEVA